MDQITFKPIAVENRDDIVSAQVAGGSFPDLVDVGGGGVPQAALSQDLVYDLKPYIDENGLQDAVGLNYTQHDMDGHIYAVHDQIESRGLWYNSDIFEKAGITEEAFADWDSFGEAMEKPCFGRGCVRIHCRTGLQLYCKHDYGFHRCRQENAGI